MERAIERVFQFKNFVEAMKFVNEVAEKAAETVKPPSRHNDSLQPGHLGVGVT